MSQIKLVALRRHPFGAGSREKGEEYEATAQEAKVLASLGWAREVVPVKVEAPKVEKMIKPAKEPAAKVAKQTYRTRDMKAKD